MNSSKKIYSLQALRAYAAILVCFVHVHHCIAIYATHFKIPQYPVLASLDSFFTSGVDLFFVISGFIISYVMSNRESDPAYCKKFILKRILRIYPPYWIVVTAYLLYTILLKGRELSMGTLLSYALYPGYRVIAISWSLTFEMLFYFLATAALFLTLRKGNLYIVLTGLVSLFYVGGAFLPPRVDYHGLTMSPLVFEFIFGILIFKLFEKNYLLNLKQALMALAAYLAIILWNINSPPLDINFEYVARWGLSSSLLVYAVISIENLGFSIPKLLTKIGDSSYSLYLTHPLIMMFIVVLWTKLNVPPMVPASILAYLLVLASIAISFIFYKFIEKPLLVQSQKIIRKVEN